MNERLSDSPLLKAMAPDAKIYVPGHTGLVGSAIMRRLEAEGYANLLAKTERELDLTDSVAVRSFFESERPDYVFLCAAKVGGIIANSTYPAEFVYINLTIGTNVIHEAWRSGVKRLIFLGSSCIYPRDCPQPMKESYLMTGPLESTNRPYALAKITGIEMCWAYNRQYGTRYMAVMPTNLYGPGDNFDLETSHVMPALIRKMHEAKESSQSKVTLWGTGSPYREFMYSEDLAEAVLFIANLPDEHYSTILGDENVPPMINIGTGKDLRIRELAELIKEVVGFEGEIEWDASKPDGTPKKLLGVSRLNDIGWSYKTELRDGIEKSYRVFLEKFA